MESLQEKRSAIKQLLTVRYTVIPRPARLLLSGLAEDDDLLSRMFFCQPEERPSLRNSLLVATEDTPCWALLLGNQPGDGAANRARLVLEGLELTAGEILDRLRPLPIWFLAFDPPFADPPPGEALHRQWTFDRLAGMAPKNVRYRAIMDQLDAALEAGDLEACQRLRNLLQQ